MLTPGNRLGPYEVVSLLGSGGMGQVYRARDARLRRDVAIKILPDSLAADPQRRVRFQREAEVLAAMSHPHVAGIHGVEESESGTALVLELVEGDTLDLRIARGPIPLADALPMATQIAEALEYAHERGIVHRDLKPSNIKIAPDGTVKVLDFGLATFTGDTSLDSLDATTSPTVTVMSRAGVLLGTAAYMSPEQARGHAADKRSDVWAFGCVLYEMITGTRAFGGQETSEILANVLKLPPDWSRLPEETPAPVRRLLRRCLEKDRKGRLGDIGTARLEIADAAGPSEDPGTSRDRSVRARRIAWAAAAMGAIAAAGAIALWAPWQTPAPNRPVRVTADLGIDGTIAIGPAAGASAVLSPDGMLMAFAGRSAGRDVATLFVRRMDQAEATALAGTEGAVNPFFSVDGQWIGFFAGGKLKKIAVTGGAPIELADTQVGLGGTWTERNTIVYQPGPQISGGRLFEVSAAGGTAAPVTTRTEGVHMWPQAIRGTNAVLFTLMNGIGALDEATLVVQELPNGPQHVVHRGGFHGRYVSSGHVLFVSRGTLFAAPFDARTFAMTSTAIPMVDGVAFAGLSGGAQVDVSDNGTLIFTPGAIPSTAESVAWLDASGQKTPLASFPRPWGTPRFSPDGRRLAVTLLGEGNNGHDIWTYDIERNVPSRLTLHPASDAVPVWTTDSRRIVFGSNRDGPVPNLYWQRTDTVDEAVRLTTSDRAQLPSSWHPTRKVLAFYDGMPPGAQHILTLEFEGDETTGWQHGEPTLLIGGEHRNVMPVFSPDGNFIAYLSNKASPGTFELYVRPYPGPGMEVQVSSGGANDPKWTKEALVYSTFVANGPSAARIVAVPYTVQDGAFDPGQPRPWTTATVSPPTVLQFGLNLDLHPEGNRLAVAAPSDSGPADRPQDEVSFVFFFADELRRRLPR